MSKTKRQKHDYTSELELKSLLIRIKNKRDEIGTLKDNDKINKYIRWHTAINNKKYKEDIAKKNRIKNKLKDKVVELSENTTIDSNSYEQFGAIILLMITRILTKPQFSGYTYRDDFYSDAIYKILRYLHNFNHKMISERSGQVVNSFAYISQIIHNSVLYIINTKKKEQDNIKEQVSMEILDHNYDIKDYSRTNESTYFEDEQGVVKEEIIKLNVISDNSSLYEEIIDIETDEFDVVKVYYPHDYIISFEEYNKIKDVLRGKISVMKMKPPKGNKK